MHNERLIKIPKANLVFACANGDISFANPIEKAKILRAMQLKPKQTFLLQTKDPSCLRDWRIPSNTIIGVTLETNRDTKKISKAPNPYYRYLWIKRLHCRKAVTIEPILDFDLKDFRNWIWYINPEIVWVGYANHSKNLFLDEPSLNKTKQLITALNYFTDVRIKTLREKR
jgi:hypothetical protein